MVHRYILSVQVLLAGGRRIGLEVFSYFMLIVGTLGDHISTMIAIQRPYIYEANPYTVKLMEMGLWLPVDLALIALGIAIPYFLIRKTGREEFRALLAYQLVHGLIRLAACVWNFSLIF